MSTERKVQENSSWTFLQSTCAICIELYFSTAIELGFLSVKNTVLDQPFLCLYCFSKNTVLQYSRSFHYVSLCVNPHINNTQGSMCLWWKSACCSKIFRIIKLLSHRLHLILSVPLAILCWRTTGIPARAHRDQSACYSQADLIPILAIINSWVYKMDKTSKCFYGCDAFYPFRRIFAKQSY